MLLLGGLLPVVRNLVNAGYAAKPPVDEVLADLGIVTFMANLESGHSGSYIEFKNILLRITAADQNDKLRIAGRFMHFNQRRTIRQTKMPVIQLALCDTPIIGSVYMPSMFRHFSNLCLSECWAILQ